jgi:hypothetical protein
MEENTEEENIKKPTEIQSENQVEEILASEEDIQTQTNNNQPQTEPMEVHHHTHDPDAPHYKKNWKSYFWEFLMLFLAVFCGFLAEYQLEHKIEKDRAKDFAISLHSDLVADTAVFKSNIRRLGICTKKIDTLIGILNNTEEVQKKVSSIYYLSAYAFISPVSTPTESTLQQLLNSGSLRYLKNNVLVDSIKDYNNRIQLFKNFTVSSASFTNEFRKTQIQIIDINPVIIFLEKNDFLTSNKAKNINDADFFSNMQLLTNEPLRMKEYANWCALKKFYSTNSIVMYKKLNLQATALLQLLSKEYSIE